MIFELHFGSKEIYCIATDGKFMAPAEQKGGELAKTFNDPSHIYYYSPNETYTQKTEWEVEKQLSELIEKFSTFDKLRIELRWGQEMFRRYRIIAYNRIQLVDLILNDIRMTKRHMPLHELK